VLETRVAERTSSLAASQEQLRKLTRQIVIAQEEERRRVSRELHDDAGQELITLRFRLETLLNELPSDHPPINQRLKEAIAQIEHTSEHIRDLSHSLRPPVLDVAGIHVSLKEYCREYSERTRVRVQYRGENIPALPDPIGICLFRFVQEATTNILRHAHASQVNIGLHHRNGIIVLSVADDGRGMDKDWRAQSAGIGLLGLEERLSLLGGQLIVKTKPGGGTRLTARIPWDAP